MATKMRLQRFGKKGRPFYHIVIADGRAPRDVRFIEKIGTYNPVHNPAEIDLKFEKALDWLQKGAQPTDTVKNILSYKGVLYKHHLLKGVRKGAMTEAQAEAKFQKWLTEKEAKIEAKRKSIEESDRNTHKANIEAETKIKEAREAELNKRRQAEEDAKVEAAKDAANAIAAQEAEKVSEEVAEKIETVEAPEAKAEETVEEKTEEAPEVKEEKVEAVEEKTDDTPEAKEEKAEAVEEKTEDAPKAEAEENKETKEETSK
ncbi:MAG: 30S ribosomal protein S16 [Marinilabiliales bacterium]|nr:MAG: 30S ribosomal protein S16 [Marinilabiliales bacterium]